MHHRKNRTTCGVAIRRGGTPGQDTPVLFGGTPLSYTYPRTPFPPHGYKM